MICYTLEACKCLYYAGMRVQEVDSEHLFVENLDFQRHVIHARYHTGGFTTFTDAREGQKNFLWMGALATSLDLVENSLKEWSEVAVQVAVLAERRVHEEGKWPADLEFPINREAEKE